MFLTIRYIGKYYGGVTMTMKVCKKCGEEKPATSEYYRKNKGAKDGLWGKCKECVKTARKIYLEENKEYIAARQKLYYEKNKERICGMSKEWVKNNKDRLSKLRKRYIEKNRDKYREDRRMQKQIRRAAKKGLPATLTIDEWNNIKLAFNTACAYCGASGELDKEHFIALTKGGEYTHNNIIPACRSCNSSKNNRDFFEWYPTHKGYSKKREDAILKFLGYGEGKQQLSLF